MPVILSIMRFLEISHHHFVQEAYPAETDFLDTSFVHFQGRRISERLKILAGQFTQLGHVAFRARYDAVFCRYMGRFIYRTDSPLPINALRLIMGWFVQLCVWMQVRRGARLAVIDHSDEYAIDHRDNFFLKLCHTYFKRELPQNVWNVFMRVHPPHREFVLLSQDPRRRREICKFAPVSLGIPAVAVARIEEAIGHVPGETTRDIDVFYAGTIDHSTVRVAGLAQLEKLRQRGYRVEVFTGRLPFEEFVRKMNRAWLVWSPEGGGWDCIRHWEVCAAGSVPLLNKPGVRRYQPLLPGVHCVEYDVEGDDLCEQVERALSDRPKLAGIAAQAREHMLRFHTNDKLGRYMVDRLLHGEDKDHDIWELARSASESLERGRTLP